MRKYLNILVYILVIILPKTSMANNNSLYTFAGILPVIQDDKNQAWIYFGVEYVNNEKRLAVLAGKKDIKDKNSLETALREMNEESLDVFADNITTSSLDKKPDNQIDYNILFLLSTKLYVAVINSKLNSDNCDQYIELYNKRRYMGTDKYTKLRLNQRETYELRKVKLNDLIEFLDSNNGSLISYGGKNCKPTDNIPLRWSSRVILKNQEVLQQLLNKS